VEYCETPVVALLSQLASDVELSRYLRNAFSIEVYDKHSFTYVKLSSTKLFYHSHVEV